MNRHIATRPAPGILALCAGLWLCSPLAYAKTHIVRIEKMAFVPETVTVAPGDTIEWRNADVVPHTVTAEDFDSDTLESSGRFRKKLKGSKEIPYFCRFHPMMKGMIRIQK